MNSTGPSTEPRGTPHGMKTGGETSPLTTKDCVPSQSYERNQPSAGPSATKRLCNVSSKISWSTVSNAELRSSSTSTVTLPESAVRKLSLNTLVRAVSILDYGLHITIQFDENTSLFTQMSRENYGHITWSKTIPSFVSSVRTSALEVNSPRL
jgi:hypothetical protein